MRGSRQRKPTRPRRDRRPAARTPERRPGAGAPVVVGIGASAGGLEAIEQFLGGVPASSGLAYVVVQHLDPTREGLMPELLQRGTRMPVEQVKDRTRVEPDHVYIIPPNKDLSIVRGVLHLVPPSSPRGLRLPIDFFLRELAHDRGATCAAVILSGMGTDGTLGIKAVKEAGGLVLVQDPGTAKFDSMPRSAIDTRLADMVAPANELPGRLIALLRGGERASSGEARAGPAGNALDKIVVLLRSRLGRDFSQYKRTTLERRIARRMAVHQITRSEGYVRYLAENPQEQQLLVSEFLIGVTSFFRDPPAWDALRDEGLPALLAGRAEGGQLRAWVPGCSTGEEAYSLAIVLKEAWEKAGTRAPCPLQIFATDLDAQAIETARQGIYPANVASDVGPERLRRFFVRQHDGTFRVSKEIRETVILAQQDVTRDPPFTRLDVIVCRNLLIYLEPELQRRLLLVFRYGLRPGGILFLGSSESISGFTGLFGAIDARLRLYRRKESPARTDPAAVPTLLSPSPFPTDTRPSAARPPPNLQAEADELILRQFGPPAVLVNERGDILYVNGRTGKYLEPAAGKANWNVFAMAREGLRYALGKALQKAARQQRAVTARALKLETSRGSEVVDLVVKPLQEPGALRGAYLVVFRDVAAAEVEPQGARARRPARHAELEHELKRLHEELRSTREDMQTSQEELRSTNEELQSTNEELQSTNEELSTSKEEMQSMNEELQTVNAELQAKVDELSRASNDMRNLLDSTEIATLFLDGSLRIRRYTEQATRFLRLIPTDAGRPITDVTTDLVFPALPESVGQVLRTLIPLEKEVATRDGRWFRVRVMPYRTLDDVIEGVVMTFMDITAAKRLEAELRAGRERFGALLEHLPDGLAVMDGRGQLVRGTSVVKSIIEARPEDLATWRIVASSSHQPARGVLP